MAYLKISRELAADKAAWDAGGWKSDLDDEILQKILPRLPGSRTRVGPLLGALGWYLHSGDKAGAMKFFPAPGEELPDKPVQDLIALGKATAAFPRSFAKVQRHGPRGDRRTIRELHLLTRSTPSAARRDATRRENPASPGRLPNKTLSAPTNLPLLTYGQMAISPYVAKTQPGAPTPSLTANPQHLQMYG